MISTDGFPFYNLKDMYNLKHFMEAEREKKSFSLVMSFYVALDS